MAKEHRRREGSGHPIRPTSAHLADTGRAYPDLNRVIDTVRQSLIVLDDKFHIKFANRAFYRTFAVTPEETVGRHLAAAGDRRLDFPALQGFLALIKAEGTDIQDYEIEMELPLLGKRVLLINAQTIHEGSLAAREILVMIDDVTDRKRREIGLMTAKWRSERTNVRKSRFLAAASHDLRQSRQALDAMRRFLTQKITDKEVSNLIAQLNQATDTMFGMLDTLLDVNQFEAGLIRPAKIEFPVNDLLHQLRIEFADQVQAHGLLWRVVPCRLNIWSDPRLLEQMIRNLLSNAIKYTEQGKILLGCRRRGAKLRIEVWDTGMGIPEEQLHLIFEEFHQLGSPARERGRGLGLGLSIVRRLGSLLGHSIDVGSRPGKGSVFAIEAPLGSEQPEGLPQRHHRGIGPGAPPGPKGDMLRPTIFVVDDEAAVREAVRGFLQDEGWWVEAYSSSEAFLEAYRPGRVGCLVVDARMPRMGGLELLERLKTEGGPPAVMITGHADIPLAVQAMKAGAMGFLEKPVRYDELLANIERALELSRNSAALSSLRKATAERIAGLTSRERQVIEMVVEGNPNKQVAYVLGISQRTVETHRATAMKKIGARSLSELIHLTIVGSPHDA